MNFTEVQICTYFYLLILESWNECLNSIFNCHFNDMSSVALMQFTYLLNMK